MSYNFTKEQIKKAYDLLPVDVQEFYSAEETSVNIYNIGTKYGLHVDALGKMGELVGLAITGLVPLIDFNKELISRTGVAPDVANLIIYDLNQEVFGPIREAMLAMVKQKVEAETASRNPKPSEPTAMNIKTDRAPAISSTPEIKSTNPSNIFSVPKVEVDVKAGVSDNVVVEGDKIRVDPYHEPIN